MNNSNYPTNKKYFDYTEVYETIKEFYMIGFPCEHHLYKLYKENRRLGQLYESKFTDPELYQKWGEMLKKIKKESPKLSVHGNTMQMQPSLGGSITIKQYNRADSIHTQELHFYLSILGPYYTIFGLDSFGLKTQNEQRKHVSLSPVLTISPSGVYEAYFDEIKQFITNEYSGITFVPYSVYSVVIKGLYLPFLHKEENGSIFQALFNSNSIHQHKYVGDISYGEEHWWK